MAKDRKKLQHIHSSIVDKQPTPQTLEVGEIAVNNAANQEFLSIKNTEDKVVRFSSDGQIIEWMERKEVMPYVGYVRGGAGPSATSAATPTADNYGSYGILESDLSGNTSEIVIKLNQVAASATTKHERVNGSKDKYNKDVNPTTDGGVNDGAGFFIDMSRYAMQGANPTFSGTTNTCYTNLNGTTKIKGVDGACGSLLEITVNSAKTDIETANTEITSATTVIGTNTTTISGNTVLNVSGTTTETKKDNVTEHNLANKSETTDANLTELVKGNNYRDVNGNYSGTTGGTTTEVKTKAVSETNLDTTSIVRHSGVTEDNKSNVVRTTSGTTTETFKGQVTENNQSGYTVNTTGNVITNTTGNTTELHNGQVTITNNSGLTETTKGNVVENVSGTTTIDRKLAVSENNQNNVTVVTSGNSDVTISGTSKVKVSGSTTADTGGNVTVTTSGKTTETKKDVVTENNLSAKTENTTGLKTENNSDSYIVNTKVNTTFNTSGTTTIQSTGNGSDVVVYAKDSICEKADNAAAFVGATKTNIGMNCADGGNTATLNVRGTTTSISAGTITQTTSGATTVNVGGALTENVTGNTTINHTGTTNYNYTGATTLSGSSLTSTTTGNTNINASASTCIQSTVNSTLGATGTTNIGTDCAGAVNSNYVNIYAKNGITETANTVTISGNTTNISGATVGISGNTTNISGATTLALSGKTVNVDATDYDLDATNVCVSGATKANFFGKQTNIGIECGGGIATGTTIKGTTVGISGNTTNISGATTLSLSGKTVNVDATDYDLDATNVCVSGATKANFYGKNTNIGIECNGTTIATNTNIKGDAIDISGGTLTEVTSGKTCIHANTDLNVGGNSNTRIGYDCSSNSGYSDNVYVSASSSAITYAPNINISGGTVNMTGTTKISISGNTTNISGNTINVSGGTLSATTTGKTCITAGSDLNLGGDANTNIGYNCAGTGIANNTNIFASTAVTINAPRTNITGDTYLSGNTYFNNTCASIDSNELSAALCEVLSRGAVSMDVTSNPAPGILKRYTIKQNDANISGTANGVIDVPKDFLLKSAAVVYGNASADRTSFTACTGTQTNCHWYIELVFNVKDGTSEESKLYLEEDDFIKDITYCNPSDASTPDTYHNVVVDINYNGKVMCVSATTTPTVHVKENLYADKAISGESLTIKDGGANISGNTTISGDTTNITGTTKLNLSGNTVNIDGSTINIESRGNACIEANDALNLGGVNEVKIGYDCSGIPITKDIRIHANKDINIDSTGFTLDSDLINITGYTNIDGNTNIKGNTSIRGNVDISGITIDMKSTGSACISAGTDLNIGGYSSTRIGYNCSGIGYSPDTRIYGEDNVTINSPQTYITGKTNISGDTIIKGDLRISGTTYGLEDLTTNYGVDVSNSTDTTKYNGSEPKTISIPTTLAQISASHIKDSNPTASTGIITIDKATNISGATTIKNDFTVTDAQNVNIDSDSVNVSGYNYVSLYSFDGMDIKAEGGDIDIKAFYKLKIDSENIRAYITSNASNLKINDNTGHNALVRLALNGDDQALLVSQNTLFSDGNYHNVFTLRTNRKDDNKQCINIQTFDTDRGGCTVIGGGEIDGGSSFTTGLTGAYVNVGFISKRDAIVEGKLWVEDNVCVTGTVTASGAIYSSDKNLKENIVSLKGNKSIFDKVADVDVVSFNFKDDENKNTKYGVIAQDVQKAGLDELVHDVNGKLGVDYTSLLMLKIAYLENTIKNLTEKIEKLENK